MAFSDTSSRALLLLFSGDCAGFDGELKAEAGGGKKACVSPS